MEEMTKEDFERMKQTASERVLEMHRDSKQHKMPFPDFVTRPERKESPKGPAPDHTPRHAKPESKPIGVSDRVHQMMQYLNLPEMMKNKDALLLLGLILLLSNDGADEKLILALAYILL